MALPETIPKVSLDTMKSWAGLSYRDLVLKIVPLFVSEEELPLSTLQGEYSSLSNICELYICCACFHCINFFFKKQFTLHTLLLCGPHGKKMGTSMLANALLLIFSHSQALKGGQGCLMFPSCLESEGCLLIPLFYLLCCFSSYSSCSFCHVPFFVFVLFCFLLIAQSHDFFPENSSIFFFLWKYFFGGIFCMAPV